MILRILHECPNNPTKFLLNFENRSAQRYSKSLNDIFRGMGQIKKKSNVETAGAGNYITVYAEANFKGNNERFEVCFIISN